MCVSLFVDLFDSMPEQSSSAASKADATPSVDLFGAGTGVHFLIPSPISMGGWFLSFFHLSALLIMSWVCPHGGLWLVACPPQWCQSEKCCFLSFSASFSLLFVFFSQLLVSPNFPSLWKISLRPHEGPLLYLNPMWLLISFLVSSLYLSPYSCHILSLIFVSLLNAAPWWKV